MKVNIVMQIQEQQSDADSKQNKTIKKGRPVSNRETKKKYTFSLLPSVYEEFSKIVNSTPNNKSVSELMHTTHQKLINKSM